MVNHDKLANKNFVTEVSALERTKSFFMDVTGTSPKLVASGSQADARLEVFNHRFLVEFRPSATTTSVSSAIEKLKQAEKTEEEQVVPLLVVPFMSGSGKTRCRDAKISWLDLSGNAEIKDRELFILVEGKPNQFKTPGRPRNPFAPKSSRIVRALLEKPTIHYYQKDLVELTDVSKALVSQVVSHLEQERQIRRLEDGSIAVVDPQLLVDEWRDNYSITDHQITRGHVYSAGPGTELVSTLGKKLNDMGVNYAFTGLSSAWHYAPFASFRIAAVFVDDPLSIVDSDRLGFSSEPRGANVWFILPNDEGVFWNTVFHQNVRFTSPLQTYLDLKGHPERADEASAEMRSFLSQGW